MSSADSLVYAGIPQRGLMLRASGNFCSPPRKQIPAYPLRLLAYASKGRTRFECRLGWQALFLDRGRFAAHCQQAFNRVLQPYS